MDISNQHENLNNDHGFVTKPYAIKKLVLNPDGTTRVVYVDTRTMKEVNPQGYTVIQADNTVENTNPKTGITPGQTVQTPQKNDDKSVSKGIIDQHDSGSVTPSGPVDSNSSGYGYYNKPGWMGLTGMIPGPIGFAGKLGNLGVNMNNTQSVNEQRAALGMTPNSTGKNIGSSMFDQNGYIGDLSTTRPDQTTDVSPVGFEAQDKNMRTTYTPEEARLRVVRNISDPATDEEKQQAIGEFKSDFPEQQSYYSKLQDSAKGLFGNLFGAKPTVTGSTPVGGYTGDHNSGFPSKPSTPTGVSVDNSPDDRDGTSTGTSPNGGYSHPGLF